jgi:hypothetical protein
VRKKDEASDRRMAIQFAALDPSKHTVTWWFNTLQASKLSAFEVWRNYCGVKT